MMHIVEDALMDSERLIPFLFLTYLAMEYLEHRAGEGMRKWIRRADKMAPVAGGLLGAVPQCGFSAAAANLYAGRVISLGTLMAIFLSTSDEMLPILISQQATLSTVAGVLLGKAAFGIAAGLAIDFIPRINFIHGKNVDVQKKGEEGRNGIPDICGKESCHCEKGIFRAALRHTAQIFFFILLFSIGLNIILHFAGEDALRNLLLNKPVIGSLLAGLVGMIPNCAGSVVITRLYLEGAMGLGAAMAGLLAGSGVGLLVLFRVNRDRKENLRIMALLYGIGVCAGIVLELILGLAG